MFMGLKLAAVLVSVATAGPAVDSATGLQRRMKILGDKSNTAGPTVAKPLSIETVSRETDTDGNVTRLAQVMIFPGREVATLTTNTAGASTISTWINGAPVEMRLLGESRAGNSVTVFRNEAPKSALKTGAKPFRALASHLAPELFAEKEVIETDAAKVRRRIYRRAEGREFALVKDFSEPVKAQPSQR